MKKINLLLALASVALSAIAQNLLTNPSFETWTAGVPTGWTLTTTAGGTVTKVSKDSLNSLQIGGPTGTYTVSQNVVPPAGASTFDTNTTYKFSVKYLVTVGDGTDARVWSGFVTSLVGVTPLVYYPIPTTHTDSLLYYIPLHGPGGNKIPLIGVSGDDTNGYLLDTRASAVWHTYTCTIKFPAGITQFNFGIRSYSTSTVIWDDMFFGPITVADAQAPTAPTGLKNTPPTANSFYLSWNASTDNVGVTGYDVYKDSVYYGTTTSLGMDVSGLIAGKTYKMTVAAKDAAGNFSPPSLPLLVTTLSNPPTGVIYNVTVPAGTKSCYIAGSMNNWSPSANAMTKVDSTHYTISIPSALVTDEYKYCSGPEWAFVEKDSAGLDIPNRSWKTNDVVVKWATTFVRNEKNVTIKVLVPQSTVLCYMYGNFNNYALPNDSSKMVKGASTSNGTYFSKTIHMIDANALLVRFCAGPTLNYDQIDPTTYFGNPMGADSISVVVKAFKAIFNPANVGTIKIKAKVPVSTKKVWITGSFLNWDILRAVEGVKNADNSFSFVIPNVNSVEYKLYNQQDFNFPEIDSTGVERVNRIANYPTDSLINITVVDWKQIVDSVIDNLAPTAPTGLKNTPPTANSFYLSWNASTDNLGVTGYEVYKDSVYYGTTTSLGMDVSGFSAGKTYKMTVEAKDAAGNFSPASLPLLVTIPMGLGVTYKVAVPSGTKACYIAGSMNGWIQQIMNKVDSTHYTVNLPAALITDEYKYCSGPAWVYVETDSVGLDIPNRTWKSSDIVVKWASIYDPAVLPLPKNVTINVSTPIGTKECYILGTFNNWAGPTADSCKMAKTGTNVDGTVKFSITRHIPDVNTLKFHFCSGPDWIYQQSAPLGEFSFPVAATSTSVVVNSWKTMYDPSAIGQNLLINPSFENWTGGVLNGWTLSTTAGGTVTKVSKDSLNALQIAGPTGTFSVSQNVVPPVGATTFDTNTTYKLSVKYLVTAGDGTDARVWSSFVTSLVGVTPVVYYAVPTTHTDSLLYYNPLHGPGGNKIPLTGVFGDDTNGYLLDNRATGVWHTYTCTFKFPAGITQLNFAIRSYIGSTVIWDDMFFGATQTIADTQAPTAPTGLKFATPTQNSFYLSWNASTDNVGVTSYEVYKDSVFVGLTTALGMNINGLTANTTYKMTVKAKDGAGNLSAASLPLLVTTTNQKVTYILSIKSADTGSANLICDGGSTPSFSFTASTGWKVNTVFYNGIDVTNSLISGILTLQPINANGLLNISFISTSAGVPELMNSNVKVYTNQSEIVVEGTSNGELVRVYNVDGVQTQIVRSQGERINLSAQLGAVYLVKTASKTFKVIL